MMTFSFFNADLIRDTTIDDNIEECIIVSSNENESNSIRDSFPGIRPDVNKYKRYEYHINMSIVQRLFFGTSSS